ncbi:MAG: efflux RND transporter periplasmic adaptor subunit [Candidatus Eiseniibacteriota bacterium]
MTHARRLIARSTLAVLALLVAGCDEKNEYVPPPPPSVTVGQPQKQPVVDYLELTGSTQPSLTATLTARVEGYLQSVNFKDGSFVKQGDLLFVIEPAPYEAKVKQQQASVEQQQALLSQATTEYERQLRLVKQNATSEANVDKWRADRDSYQAALDAAKANLDLAQINLGYTQVKAPFDGRIGRHLVDPGNLVGASGAPTKLATIDDLDPMFAYFNVSENDVLRIRDSLRKRGLARPGAETTVSVDVGLQTEDGYPHKGRLDFIDTGVDPSTGTLLIRAVLPNADRTFLPGLFVRIRIPYERREGALLVSDRAVGVDQSGRYVLVVNKENVVEQKTVQVGQLVDGMRVIDKGIAADEWVVIDGLQRAIPGAKVSPKRAETAATGQAAPAPAVDAPKKP